MAKGKTYTPGIGIYIYVPAIIEETIFWYGHVIIIGNYYFSMAYVRIIVNRKRTLEMKIFAIIRKMNFIAKMTHTNHNNFSYIK